VELLSLIKTSLNTKRKERTPALKRMELL
jgi:hypothetical protein